MGAGPPAGEAAGASVPNDDEATCEAVAPLTIAVNAALTALERGPAPAPLGGPLPPLCGDDERAEE